MTALRSLFSELSASIAIRYPPALIAALCAAWLGALGDTVFKAFTHQTDPLLLVELPLELTWIIVLWGAAQLVRGSR